MSFLPEIPCAQGDYLDVHVHVFGAPATKPELAELKQLRREWRETHAGVVEKQIAEGGLPINEGGSTRPEMGFTHLLSLLSVANGMGRWSAHDSFSDDLLLFEHDPDSPLHLWPSQMIMEYHRQKPGVADGSLLYDPFMGEPIGEGVRVEG